MNWIIRALLGILYFLTLPLMLLTKSAAKRRLQLDDPGTASYWIVRKGDADRDSYFSESSVAEGATAPREGAEGGPRIGGGSFWLASLLVMLSGMFKPREALPGSKAAPSIADRDKGVPDEIYTLW
jgi:hypothetical protein